MKSKIGKWLGLIFVLIITSPITIAAWCVNDKKLSETFGEIIDANKENLQ